MHRAGRTHTWKCIEMESRKGPNRVRLESSVRHLQQLYTIVAGLALADAISTIIQGSDTGWRNPLALTLLVAFLVTLVPFFHGALRHFDETYLLPEETSTIGRSSLAVDFGFLFVESGLLFGLAHQMHSTAGFAVFLGLLLGVDVAWVVAIRGASTEGRPFWEEMLMIVSSPTKSVIAHENWAQNNVLYLIILIFMSVVAHYSWPGREVLQGVVILMVAIARTVWDYVGSFQFYFPE